MYYPEGVKQKKLCHVSQFIEVYLFYEKSMEG